MKKPSALVVAENVRRLMDDRDWKIRDLVKASGISRSSLQYLLKFDPENETARHPASSTIDAIAEAFNVPVFVLWVDDLPVDATNNQQLPKLVRNYLDSGTEGRAAVDRLTAAVAEGEKLVASKR